jgi:dihydroorotate dehydrogenase
LRELQGAAALAELLGIISEQNLITRKPIVVKIAPDLAPNELEQVVATCESHRVAAIIATNTTIDHSAIRPDKDEPGGLSGLPLREKSTQFVRTIAARSSIPIIASGGIIDAHSAREKIAAGAQLLQIYTGLIYRGPSLLREIADGIS